MSGFGGRLAEAVADRGPLCVGIDPHPFLLEQWGLDDSAESLERLGMTVVDAAAGRVGVVKPQAAFFERHGSAGYAALERVIAAARAAGLIVIADAKRGDMGTSVEAYGQAWLTPGSPLEVDAMTLSAFQGLGSIAAPLALAELHGKGVFVLCATSNPEAAGIQLRADDDGVTVSAAIERDVIAWNDEHRRAGADGEHGSVGLVVGATVSAARYGVSMASTAPILAPGFGFQGARLGSYSSTFETPATVLASVSRSVLGAGADGLADAIDRASAEVA